MSAAQTNGFFQKALIDKEVQGQLYHALSLLSPQTVAHLAQAHGYKVTANDIKKLVGSSTAGIKPKPNVVAGDFWGKFSPSASWKRLLDRAFDPFREAPPFNMTIPGPQWVQVMGGMNTSDAGGPRPSALELYDRV